MLKRVGSLTKRASSIAQKTQFTVEVHQITFSDSPEAPIGSEILIQDDHDANDGISSTIFQKGQIDFDKVFSLNVTMYKDKKDVFLEKQRKLIVKIKTPKDSSYKTFGYLLLNLGEIARGNGPQDVSVGVSDCIVSAAIASLTVTYSSNRDRSASDTPSSITESIPNPPSISHRPSLASSLSLSSIQEPQPHSVKYSQPIDTPATSITPPLSLADSVQRRNSLQRRASWKNSASFRMIGEENEEEEKAHRLTRELVDRINRQNEDYKKSNSLLKSQLDEIVNQLVQSNLQCAELMTEIEREKFEKRKLRERLQWYDWSESLSVLTTFDWAKYLDTSSWTGIWTPTTTISQYPSEPDASELKDTE